MPDSTSDKAQQPYASGPFIRPEVTGDCDDCKAYVIRWSKHMTKRTAAGHLSEDYDPSAASDEAVLWKRHQAEAHGEAP